MKNAKRVLSVLLCILMLICFVPMTALAEGESSYEPVDPYVWKYYGNVTGKYMSLYASPYAPLLQYDVAGEEPYLENLGINVLYNIETDEYIPVYCVDEYTSVVNGSIYRRDNLEDSAFFSKDAAELIRAVYLGGFPMVSLEELSEASGVENLTLGEAISATQLALWKASYGDALTIIKYVDSITNLWTKWWFSASIVNYNEYYEEYSGYAQQTPLETLNDRIGRCVEYLLDLDPADYDEKAVSKKSFVSCDCAIVEENTDGTVDLCVTADIDVTEKAGDDLKLSIIAGETVKTVELVNGLQSVETVIENVPASQCDDIKLAIDGTQSAEDVSLYTSKGGREVAQSFVGYNSYSLPVHEEISVGPERIVKIHKTDKIVVGTDDNGREIYDHVDLEGIVFDFYYVADWNDYLNGKIDLPEPEDMDIGSLGDPTYHYPDYTAVTDSNGYAEFNITKAGLPDGVYLVVERKHSAIVEPVKPFYIIMPYTNEDGTGWEYELTVSPKNDVKSEVKIVKDVIRLDNDLASVDAYKNHLWIVSTSIPEDIADGKEYVITDTIDNRLDYIGNMVIRVEYAKELAEDAEPIEPVTLIPDVDYVLEVVDTDQLSEGKPNDSFTVSLTKAGMKKVGATVGQNSADYMIRTYYDAQINANAVLGELIPNQAFLDYTNSVNYHFRVESDIPKVYTCGIRLLKVDSKNNAVTLKGAEFEVYRTVTAKELNEDSVVKTTIEGISAPVTKVEFFDNVKLEGKHVTVATSDENGNVIIYGLAEGDEFYSIADVEYYFVETKSPDGYNLLGAPVKLEINKISHLEENAVKVENTGGTVLPDTGGIGTGIYMILGIALMLAPAAVLVTRKIRQK